MPSMPGRAISGNLYGQQLVRAFLSQYGAHYDYVIFDAPPVLESPETTVLGGAVDTSLLVVRAAHTKGGVVNRAIESLAKAGVPVLGVVLNRRRLEIPDFLYKRI
jgi:Mrp family chromosome partitioning ATPase